MEMPIAVMITLFVALVVGMTVLSFSKGMIDRSKEQLRPDDDKILDEEKIIELLVLDNQQVVDLVTECYSRHHSKTFDRELCFSVHADSVSNTLRFAEVQSIANSSIGANVVLKDVVDTDYAIMIYFDPYGDTEKIEISR